MADTNQTQGKPAPKKTPPAKAKPAKKSNGATQTAVVKRTDLTLPEKWNRMKVGDIRGLIASIRERGLQVPLTVRPDPNKKGKFEITDGRRRYAAIQEVKLEEVPVNIRQTTSEEAFLDSILINLQREDNTDYELALAFGQCVESGMNGKEIARACGKTEGFVSHRLAVLKLPDKWQAKVKTGALSVTHARMAATLFTSEDKKDAAFAEKLLEKFVAGKLNSTQGQERLDKYLEKKAAAAKAKGEKVKGKAKKGAKGTTKGKSAAAAKGAGKSEPEVPKTAYTPEVQKAMKMITVKDSTEWLQHYEERLGRTKSEKNRTRLKGIIEGLEIGCGLRSED
jgi:ParB/RepB/Spo0J family partition protein